MPGLTNRRKAQATIGDQPKTNRPATSKRKQPEPQAASDAQQSEPQDPAGAPLPPVTSAEGKQSGKQGGRQRKGTSAAAQAAAEAAAATAGVTTRSQAALGDSKSKNSSARAAAQGPSPPPAGRAMSAADAADGSDEEQDRGEDAGDAEVPEGVQDDPASDDDVAASDGMPDMEAFPPEAAAALDAFDEAAGRPQAYLQPSKPVAELARLAAKTLFDQLAPGSATPGTEAAASGNGEVVAAQPLAASGALQELYVDGFDAEQIWLQLDQASVPLLKHVRKLLRKAGSEPRLLLPNVEEDLEDLLEGVGASEDSADEKAELDNEAAEDAEDSASDLEEPPAAKRRPGRAVKVAEGQLPTEDRFLRLADMEDFLQDAERLAAAEEGGEDEDAEGLLGADLEDPAAAGSEDDGSLDLGEADDALADSDADLDDLLEASNQLAGRQKRRPVRTNKGKKRAVEDMDEDELQGGEDIMYSDFFGAADQADAGDSQFNEEDSAEEGDLGTGADEAEGLLEDEDEGDGSDREGGRTEELDDDMGLFGEHAVARQRGARESVPSSSQGDLLADEAAPGPDSAGLSQHERRQARLQERIARLEAENIGEKDWFLKGEAGAGQRPLNSALEVDLDFDRKVKPPPQPTEEATASLEDLIKKRIADQQFDDPPKVVPPPPEKQRVVVELDDKRSSKGLGELYEEQYVSAATGVTTAADRQQPVRDDARRLMRELFVRLDSLTHYHYAPKPVLEELQVRSDVPALAMEEVAPQVASAATMRAPEEVFQSAQHGQPRTAEELTREQRRAARAKRKRGGKNEKEGQADDKRLKPSHLGGKAVIVGRKSEAEGVAAAQAGKQKKKKGSREAAPVKAKKMDYTKSGAVFKHLQEQRDAAEAGTDKRAKPAAGTLGATRPAAAFKL